MSTAETRLPAEIAPTLHHRRMLARYVVLKSKATHLAALADGISGVLADSPLARFQELAESEAYAWPPDAFVPDVLLHCDVPELLAALRPMPILLTNPLNAVKQPLKAPAEVYSAALESHPGLEIRPNLSPQETLQAQLAWLGKVGAS